MPQETRNCQNCKNDFTIEPEDFAFYEKVKVPPPTWCPECRLIRRLAWRNERALYKQKCKLCGEGIISMYSPEGPVTSYCSPCWWSDKWNPLAHGREYDFSKTFFEQFQELMHDVPHQNVSVSYKTLVNSDYCNMNHELKNCYWLFNSDYNERCLYGEEIERSKDCIDVTMLEGSELVAHSINCVKCYQTYYSEDCEGCHNVWLSKNLSNCNNCFGCANLRGKEYHIFNKPYSKDEYKKKLEEYNVNSFSGLEKIRKEAYDFWLKYPQKYMHGRQNKDVSGDYIYHSRNVRDSYIVTESDHCRYCAWLISNANKSCYDFTQFGENTQLIYESLVCGKNVSSLVGCQFVLETQNTNYSTHCFNNNSDIFGCIGLRSKKYCILNKEYSPEEYQALKAKIVKHMDEMPYTDKKGRVYKYGDFFPVELSPFGYNETTAQENKPLNKEEAEKLGYLWRDMAEKTHKPTKSWKDLPDKIEDVDESTLGEIISCKAWDENQSDAEKHNCSKAFRVMSAELPFCKQMGIPLPRFCPNTRHFLRLQRRNPWKLWARKCQCAGVKSENSVYKNTASHQHHGENHCPNEFETSYSPERKEIVYCEECYQTEVV